MTSGVTFNVREELLVSLPMGKEVDVMIPALGKKVVKVKIYYIKGHGQLCRLECHKGNRAIRQQDVPSKGSTCGGY